MSTEVFNAYSRYYDLLYLDKNYSGEVDYIKSLLRRHSVTQGEILEFGSGTGKHGRLLAEDGYTVHGIERSAEMVGLAKQERGFTCEVGDICNIQLNRNFDVVLSLFHVVSYQITNANLNAVFDSAVQHLRSGGLFIFDFWYTPAVFLNKPSVRVKRMADKDIEIVRIAEPTIHINENRVDVGYTIFATDRSTGKVETLEEMHPMRHFSLLEIELVAIQHGFKVIGSEEFLSGSKPSEHTWGVCVILEKE